MGKKGGAGLAIFFVAILLIAAAFFLIPRPASITGAATNSTSLGNFSVSITPFIVACTFSNDALNVSFGTVLAGINGLNASKNYNGTNSTTLYNITADVLSNTNIDVLIKGANLTSGSDILAIGNATWSSNSTSANGANMDYVSGIIYRLTEAYNTANFVANNTAPGNTTHFRFWLDIPLVQPSGNYTGNYTMLCQPHS